MGLEIQSECGRDPEGALQPKRRVGGDAAAPAQDVADPVPGHAQRLGQPSSLAETSNSWSAAILATGNGDGHVLV